MRSAVFFLSGLLIAGTASADTLTAYNSYQVPPFVTTDGGLASDLVSILNQKLAGKYEFKLANIARPKLNSVVLDSPSFNGIALFLNPMFVGDEGKSRFGWSESIMKDGNAVVSAAARPFDFKGLESFAGKSFLGVYGNKYAGLDEQTAKGVKREDALNEEANLKKLVEGKGDVTILARSITSYYQSRPEFTGKLAVAGKPFSSFTRHILVAKGNPALLEAINNAVKGLENDPAWKAALKKYGQ